MNSSWRRAGENTRIACEDLSHYLTPGLNGQALRVSPYLSGGACMGRVRQVLPDIWTVRCSPTIMTSVGVVAKGSSPLA